MLYVIRTTKVLMKFSFFATLYRKRYVKSIKLFASIAKKVVAFADRGLPPLRVPFFYIFTIS